MAAPVADPADIAAVQDILKEVFPSDELESQLYEGTIALDFFEEVTEYTNSDGDGASVPIKKGRTGAVGARGVGELLPPADHQKPAKARYFYKNLYVTVQVYGPVVAKMKTNRQACVREIDFEINGAITDFKRDFCRQLHNDGSGLVTIAALPGNAANTVIPLGAGNAPVVERGWLYDGLPVDIGTVADPDARVEGNAGSPTTTTTRLRRRSPWTVPASRSRRATTSRSTETGERLSPATSARARSWVSRGSSPTTFRSAPSIRQ